MAMFFNSKNYYKLLKEISMLDIYGLLSIHSQIGPIQRLLLERIATAYSSQTCKFPLKTLAIWLCPFEKRNRALGEWLEEVLTNCNHESKAVDDTKYVQFSKSTFKSVKVILKRRIQ